MAGWFKYKKYSGIIGVIIGARGSGRSFYTNKIRRKHEKRNNI